MAASSPRRFFAAWRVEAPFSVVSRLDGFYAWWSFLVRGVAFHESSSCSREDSLDDCGCPCNPLFCLLFSALWLRCSQSLFVQETQSAKDLDLTCSATFLLRDATCLPVGPMSLEWPIKPFWQIRFVRTLASSRCPQRRTTTRCFSSLYTLSLEIGCSSSTEHLGACWICFLQTKEQRIQTQISQKTLGQQQHHLSPGSAWKG